MTDAQQAAALAIGDDAFSRVKKANWMSFANKRCRQMCMLMQLVKRRAYFDIYADQADYAMPDGCVQMTRLQFTPTPADVSTFRELREKFEDEFRADTTNAYPTGDPAHYFADQGFFYLLPKPTATYALGGKIEYWGLPDTITTELDELPIPDTMFDLLVEGMVIDAQRKMEKIEEANIAERSWLESIDKTRYKLEDRSNDRRSNVRLGPMRRGFWGQT